MKRFLIQGTIGVILFIAIIGIWGLSLSETHSVTRMIKLNSPPSEVWEKLTDLGSTPEWNEMVVSAEPLQASPGLPERWKMTYTDGHHILLENIILENQQLMSSQIKETSYPFSGNWIFELKAYGSDSNKTLLTLTENGTVTNPFCRVIAYVMGYDMAVEQFLEQLANALGQPNTPIEP